MKGSPSIHDIIAMVTHGHEQVKEQFPPKFHFHLHGSATLEGLPATDDEREVVSAQPRITVWCVLVGIARAAQDGADLDPALQALLAQGELLELFEAVAISSTVHGRVAEDDVVDTRVVKGGFDGGCAVAFVWVRAVHCALEHPGLAALVMDQARIVVTLVEILQDTREDFGLLRRQVNASSGGFEELAPQNLGEVGGVGKDVFVCGEQSLVGANNDGHDGRGEARGDGLPHRTVHAHGFHLVDDVPLLVVGLAK